jgi:proteic killer suppression protein
MRLFTRDDASGVRADMVKRIRRRLSVLHIVEALNELRLPGFDFHVLRGKPKRYSIHVNGPWCITFEWIDGNAFRVELEQYH